MGRLMIRHCVFLRLKRDYDAGALQTAFDGLAAVADRLAGATGFVAGPNLDFEGKSQEYPAGFTIDFTSADALQTYANDPEHQSLGAQLVSQCVGGAAGIIVYDLEFPAQSGA